MNRKCCAALCVYAVACLSHFLSACSGEFRSCYTTYTCPAGGRSAGGDAGDEGGEAGEAGSRGGEGPVSGGRSGDHGPQGQAGTTTNGGAGGEAGISGEAGLGAEGGAVPTGCGNSKVDPGEDCDLGPENDPDAYGPGLCTNRCKKAPFCGDGKRNGAEACDEAASGSTALGACDPECTGYYEKKFIRPTFTATPLSGNLGGISGADATCVSQFGAGWKALLVGKTRRATVTPLLGDQQSDWVLHKYRHYYNETNELIWRTDEVALLGVRSGKRLEIYADLFPATGTYPWTGFKLDWTTFADNPSASEGTCSSWTTDNGNGFGDFVTPDLTTVASEPCGAGAFILCVQQ